MKKDVGKSKGSLLWRIIFGILLIIISLISLSRFNVIAASFYIIISIFIFIPGRIFKIKNKWIKIVIVIILIFSVGLINHFFINSGGTNIEEYKLGQEFPLPGNSNFSVVVTKAVEESRITVGEQEYTTDELFLLIYFKMEFIGNLSNETNLYEIPFEMSFGLKDLGNNEYDMFNIDTTNMPQTQFLEQGESLHVFSINKNSTSLIFYFSDEDMKNIAIIDLEI